MNSLLGKVAPNFVLPDQYGKKHKISNYRGSWLVLYFYPKDNTPGCTLEACAFRDSFIIFKENNIKILGVSADNKISHDKFINKFNLPFVLLSDENRRVITKYQVGGIKNFFGKKINTISRQTFLINPVGRIVKIYKKFDINKHPQEILKDIRKIQSEI